MIEGCIACSNFWSCKTSRNKYRRAKVLYPDPPIEKTIRFDEQNRLIPYDYPEIDKRVEYMKCVWETCKVKDHG